MGQGDVLPFGESSSPSMSMGSTRRIALALSTPMSMERNKAEKLPALSSCSKRMNEQISIKRQVVSSMVPLK